jgi:hypothetical protein
VQLLVEQEIDLGVWEKRSNQGGRAGLQFARVVDPTTLKRLKNPYPKTYREKNVFVVRKHCKLYPKLQPLLLFSQWENEVAKMKMYQSRRKGRPLSPQSSLMRRL